MEILKEGKKDRKQYRYYSYDIKDCNAIKVEVYYALGGINYFTNTQEGRGVYLSVTPVEVGDIFEKFSAFSGYKTLVEEANRYSSSLIDRNVDYLDINNAKTQELFQAVLAK